MAVALAVVLVVLVVGSLVYHFLSPWYFTEIASNWDLIDLTVDITFWVCGFVFVAVNLFTAYCVVKFRHRPGHKAHYEPESHKLEIGLTIFTSIGVAAMLAPGLIAWGDFVRVPEGAMQVEAVGKQWHWSYRFPGEDGQFGNTDVRQMTVDNPLGVDPSDPAGEDDIVVTQPIVHLPLDQDTHMLLRSSDVLHNFTVPQFRVKMDLVPGMVTYQWFRPTVEGTYEVLCEELCGIGHFAMRSKVVVQSRDAFETWLDAQPTFAETQDRPVGNPTRGATTYAVCLACHGAEGQGNQAMNAPKLAGQEPWYIRRQIANYQSGRRGTEDNIAVQMAAMAAVMTTPGVIEDVIAYIGTFPDEPAETTIVGDVDRGRGLYQTCALCHGDEGQGSWNANAPRLAGMSDWSLHRQLMKFKEPDPAARRGGHPDDIYGDQMNLMAVLLKDEAAISDVIAYINTLP
ncbi:MAG TPA: c-type cytochrome [Gammaproteobacteria bacterium]|nr:c-type cytochrome [Gammaproteobacteria bacterium]